MFQLLAKEGDVDLHVVVLGVGLGAPDFHDEVFLRDDDVRRGHEEPHDLEFFRTEGQGLAVALQEGEGLLGLEAEELRPLFAFAATLGKGEAEGEVQLCIRTEAELERGLLKRREEAPRRTRVSQTLSISGALMLLLLLL